MKKIKIADLIKYLILSAATLVFVFPLVWVFYNSFKTNSELFANPWNLAQRLSLENYVYAWKQANIGRYFLNSVIVCSVSLILCLILSCAAGYALTRLKWKLSDAVMMIFLVGMMIPIHSTLIPLFLMFSRMGIINSHLSLIIPYTVSGMPIAVFIMTGFLKNFPAEIEESAVIDGASMRTVFFHITLPIARPSIATVAIYTFVSMWNELNYALVFLSDQRKMTVPIGLNAFKGQYATNYVALFAAVMITILPSLIVFSVFNRQVIEGMTSGAVKG